MAYASSSDVAALTKNLIRPATTYTTATCPTSKEVGNWLSSGCSIIEAHLGTNGYAIPAASGTVIFDWLRDLNALWGGARAEQSRTHDTVTPGERTRWQVMEESFWDQLERLTQLDLTRVGLSRSATGKLYVGGISIAEKQTRESDSDRVEPRFRRSQFSFPGTLRPDNSTASKK